ncbi:hypothetical protein [Leuconostoc citreum]|uniref:hypothetical protein n=1 Tax=Leuconostoc citreum TaxID=33964 RepID=UPI000BFEADCA|nr:hypothetical protein [Leuconostoc citreum]
MVIINDRTIELLTESDSFAMNVNQLAYSLKITKEQAKSELLYELYVHRLKDNITGPLTPAEQRMITYARKDIERNYFKELNEVIENEVSDEVVDIENIPKVSYVLDTYEIDNYQFNTLLNCFHSTQRNFVSRLILTGQERTQESLDLTTKRFNQQLKRILAYVKSHKERFRQELTMNVEKDRRQTINDIDEFFSVYESPFVTNQQILDEFLKHQDEEPFAIALDRVKYQGKLFEDWNGYAERTEFLLELNYQQQVLLDKEHAKSA